MSFIVGTSKDVNYDYELLEVFFITKNKLFNLYFI